MTVRGDPEYVRSVAWHPCWMTTQPASAITRFADMMLEVAGIVTSIGALHA